MLTLKQHTELPHFCYKFDCIIAVNSVNRLFVFFQTFLPYAHKLTVITDKLLLNIVET